MLRNAILAGIAAGLAAAMSVAQSGGGPLTMLFAYGCVGSAVLVLSAMAQAKGRA